MPTLNARSVINHFGGPTNLSRLAKSAGYTISRDQVNKWSERNSIPSASLVSLMDMGKRYDKRLVLEDHIFQDM